jgi:hypothetical protein
MGKILNTKKPSGTSEFDFFLQDIWEAIENRTRIIPRAGVLDVAYTDKGIEITPAGSRGGGTVDVAMRVKSVQANYITCRSWNGVDEGTSDILVAKPFIARQPSSATVAGTNYTYTYSAGPDALNSYRDSDDGSTVEEQVVTPYWSVNDVIHVSGISFSGVNNPADSDIKLIEVSGRCWAKVT